MADTASGHLVPNKPLTAVWRFRWRPGAPTKLAILIDGENVSLKIVPALFYHMLAFGTRKLGASM